MRVKFGTGHREVLDLVAKAPDLTPTEYASRLGRHPQGVARVLREMDGEHVQRSIKRVCRVSGRKAETWRAK